jgi:hypothetical protein
MYSKRWIAASRSTVERVVRRASSSRVSRAALSAPEGSGATGRTATSMSDRGDASPRAEEPKR